MFLKRIIHKNRETVKIADYLEYRRCRRAIIIFR